MGLLLRHKLLIAGATLVAAASAGGAYAATQSATNPRQAFLNDVAKRLHVSPTQLRSALKAALLDRLQAAVKSGKLTQAQANRIAHGIEQNGRLPLFFAPGGHFGFRAHAFFRGGALGAAASYLGLTDVQLLRDLRSGQSLAQIAKARGKSVTGLEQAITSAEKAQLDRAAAAGLITKAQEQRLLSRLSAKIGRLVNRTGLGRLRITGRLGRVLPGGPLPQGAPMIPPAGGPAAPPAAGFGAPPLT